MLRLMVSFTSASIGCVCVGVVADGVSACACTEGEAEAGIGAINSCGRLARRRRWRRSLSRQTYRPAQSALLARAPGPLHIFLTGWVTHAGPMSSPVPLHSLILINYPPPPHHLPPTPLPQSEPTLHYLVFRRNQ